MRRRIPEALPDGRVRVLVVTPDFPPAHGGIQLLVHRHVAHWTRLSPKVVTLASAGDRAFDHREAFPVRRVSRIASWRRTSIGMLNARALLEARNYDPQVVLNAHIVTSPAAWLARRMVGAPFVQYIYADEVAARPRLAAFALSRAAAVVAISAHTEALARSRGVDSGRLHRIPPGVDLPDARSDQRSPRPLVITVARLADGYKGHDILIRALPLIRQRVPDVLWIVIGDGPLRPRYEEMVRALGLGEHVRFLGWLSEEERNVWLDRAHVFAMPSRLPHNGGGEGFGIVYMEAGVHRLPVVAGNVAGALDAVVDGVTGLLVDPTDPPAVADAVSKLLADESLAQRLGRAGLERARRFTWPTVARQSEQLLLDVVAERR